MYSALYLSFNTVYRTVRVYVRRTYVHTKNMYTATATYAAATVYTMDAVYTAEDVCTAAAVHTHRVSHP